MLFTFFYFKWPFHILPLRSSSILFAGSNVVVTKFRAFTARLSSTHCRNLSKRPVAGGPSRNLQKPDWNGDEWSNLFNQFNYIVYIVYIVNVYIMCFRCLPCFRSWGSNCPNEIESPASWWSFLWLPMRSWRALPKLPVVLTCLKGFACLYLQRLATSWSLPKWTILIASSCLFEPNTKLRQSSSASAVQLPKCMHWSAALALIFDNDIDSPSKNLCQSISRTTSCKKQLLTSRF